MASVAFGTGDIRSNLIKNFRTD